MIVVWGMFKVGSSTIFNTLKENFPNNNIKKIHVDLNILFNDELSVLIIPVRKNKKEQYISAYFMDIIEDVYEYSPFNRILKNFKEVSSEEKKEIIVKIDAKLLLDDYETIDWNKYYWLNIDICLDMIEKNFDLENKINIKNIDTIHVYNASRKIDNKKIKIIFIITEKINEINLIDLCEKSNLNFKKDKFKMVLSNIGKDKWYGKKYEEFLKLKKNEIMFKKLN